MRTDSIGLMNVFGNIGNSLTGIGTDRAKINNIAITKGRQLSRSQLQILFEDELLRKVVCLFPENAAKAWFNLSIPNNKVGNDIPELLLRYVDSLGSRGDQTELESMSDLYGASQAFLIAAILARQFGKAYILMGIDDGQSFDQPINKNAIKSIRWLQILEDWELQPEIEFRTRSPNYYILNTDDNQLEVSTKIHKSRLLPFWGNRIYSKFSYNYQDGISIIQSMFDAYCDWIQGVKAGSSMLADYDVFTLGMKGLGQLLLNDKQANTTAGQDAVMNRALALDMGKSVVRGILYDMENESPGSITRAYQGADAIMGSLESRWVAVSGIPKTKLFGELGSQGLTNNQGLAMRSEWALLVQNYAYQWVDNLRSLITYSFLAKDSPTNGKLPDTFDLVPRFDLQLTDTEKMEYEKIAGDRSKLLVDMGAITADEVRSGYQGSKFSPDLVLSSKKAPSPPSPEQPKRTDTSGVLTDKEWEDFANISAQDFINTAEEIADEEH